MKLTDPYPHVKSVAALRRAKGDSKGYLQPKTRPCLAVLVTLDSPRRRALTFPEVDRCTSAACRARAAHKARVAYAQLARHSAARRLRGSSAHSPR